MEKLTSRSSCMAHVMLVMLQPPMNVESAVLVSREDLGWQISRVTYWDMYEVALTAAMGSVLATVPTPVVSAVLGTIVNMADDLLDMSVSSLFFAVSAYGTTIQRCAC